MKSLSGFKATKTVFGYLFPEVKDAIKELYNQYPFGLFQDGCEPPGLDDWHIPIIEKYIDFLRASVPRLRDFVFRYPTANGSEEGIREILTWLQSRKVKTIYVFRGEYEGYKEVAKTRGIQTVEVDFRTDPENLKEGYWFLSNPSARDGNIISNEFINCICDAGHQVFYDLAYLGLTKQHRFDLSHPNIFAVATSLSKSFGLFYFRIGYVFTKEEVPSLFGNRLWFKSVPNLLITQQITEKINPGDIPKKYKAIQEKIVREINEEFTLETRPSEALLLAYLRRERTEGLSENQQEMITPFLRADSYRFCLARYFRDIEKMNEK